MRKRIVIAGGVFIAFVLCFICIFSFITPKEKQEKHGTYVSKTEIVSKDMEPVNPQIIEEQPSITVEPTEPVLYADGLDFERVSSNRIQITWSTLRDDTVESYLLQRRDAKNSAGVGEWMTVETVGGDEPAEDGKLSIVDELNDTAWKQYEYRVQIKSDTAEDNTLLEEKTILASNVLVCIDPGHFSGRNSVPGENSYGYAEGDFTLPVALELKNNLKTEYGIDSYMTRETGTITIDGYTDKALDGGPISLRGEYAQKRDSDLFVSIHTNANKDNANGYGTFDQPISLNKPLIIANELANLDINIVNLCNAVGVNLTKVNYSLGISSINTFQTIEPSGAIPWTDEYNDSLEVSGTVVKRLADRGGDFYGVLKGANRKGIPGIIIEHAYHTVEKTRKEAMQGELKEAWAKADAYGLAYGFGFVEKMEMTITD